MPEVIGYTTPLAVRPGEPVDVMVSTTEDRYAAQVVRLRHGDRSERGPGERWSTAGFGPSGADGERPGRRQAARPGSFGVAPVDIPAGPVTVQAWCLPTLPGSGQRQGIVTLGNGVGLELDAAGRLAAVLPGGTTLRTDHPVTAHAWLFVCLVVGPAGGTAFLDVRETAWPRRRARVSASSTRLPGPAAEVVLAARSVDRAREPWARRDGFDGRIEAPSIYAAALDAAEVDLLAAGRTINREPVARWRFEADPAGSSVATEPSGGPPLRLVHAPQRLVLGHHDRADALGDFPPSSLTAVHFHQDDLEDAGWEPDLAFTVPEGTRSGVYAVRLEAGGESGGGGDGGDLDVVPFFVRPPQGTATAEVAVLFPTFSYLAYANERLQEAPRDMEPGDERALPILPDRGDHILQRRHDLGLSVYDTHADGSGCCYSTARRPILNMRPDHRNWQTHAPRALAADLYLVDWLDELAVPFDALDDGLLHDEGLALLERYRVVITGAHPEYWSEQMLDALEGYLEGGGRLMYLGGNGFYWVTSVDPERPHLIEVRRGHNGTRPWEPPPGELRHATTGEKGGLWRYRGRGPNRVAGVGFSAQGYSPKAAPYHRLDDAADARAAWMFAGVPEGAIGDAGLIMDGAAGDEMDRADVGWGTPPHALVVATSAGGHTDDVSVVVEDLLIAHPGVGGTRHPLVRSDVVFFETAEGGAVFSGASMGWTGCLSHDGYANPLARLTENVLRRFLDPEPFPDPAPLVEPAPLAGSADGV